jgi:fatty acid desaturase
MRENKKTLFSIQEARHIVSDLMQPDPVIYWSDFLLSISIAWSAYLVAVRAEAASFEQMAGILVAALAFYRAVIFIHELAHLKMGSFRLFRLLWNISCGTPLLLPSFAYDGVHNDHHKPDIYGTVNDGEYLPFARSSPLVMIGYVAQSLIIPAALIIRFAVLTPLSIFLPPLRRWLWAHASSLVINPLYVRSPHAIRADINWRTYEFAVSAFSVAVITGVITGTIPAEYVVLWYAIAVLAFFLNSIRTLAAHAYRHGQTEPLSLLDQFLDSVDVPGNRVLNALWAPVGLRYHATHHLFPHMPCHNLHRAHKRLRTRLPHKESYLLAARPDLLTALARIWREASR